MEHAEQRMTPLRIFIAGPMTTSGEPGPNTHAACTLAGRLLRAGQHPIIPHLNWFAHAIDPETSVEAWMEWGLREVERADAVIRLRGASCGADAECLRAEELGIPIVRIDSIPDDLRLLRELLEEESGDQHQVDEYTTTSRGDWVTPQSPLMGMYQTRQGSECPSEDHVDQSQDVEGYPSHWKHARIHLDPDTGELHSEGDHSVREWIERRVADCKSAKRACDEWQASYRKLEERSTRGATLGEQHLCESLRRDLEQLRQENGSLRNELRLVKHAKAKLEGELQGAKILLAGKEGQA